MKKSPKNSRKRVLLLLAVIMSLVSVEVTAQDGNHLFINYAIEHNTWKLDDYQSVSTTVSYPHITWLKAWHDGSFEMAAPGIFSTVLGNVYVTASDDSLQISNVNMLTMNFQHLLWGPDSDLHNFGWSWGLDFLGHTLNTGAEEGKFGDEGIKVAQLTGLGVNLGATYLYNLEDRLLIDGSIIYKLVFNSGAASRNSQTFHGSGFLLHGKARYYLSYNWVAHADLQFQTLSHEKEDVNKEADQAGRFSFVNFSLGFGYQW